MERWVGKSRWRNIDPHGAGRASAFRSVFRVLRKNGTLKAFPSDCLDRELPKTYRSPCFPKNGSLMPPAGAIRTSVCITGRIGACFRIQHFTRGGSHEARPVLSRGLDLLAGRQ
jgi:hypothetical protein